MASNTIMVNSDRVRALTSNPAFFDRFPEFRTLSTKKPVKIRRGCCGRRTTTFNSDNSTFMQIMSGLEPHRLEAVKQALGAPRVMYSYQDPVTGVFVTRTL